MYFGIVRTLFRLRHALAVKKTCLYKENIRSKVSGYIFMKETKLP